MTRTAATRIAINGMGRIGRALLRRAATGHELEVVAVNDVAPLDTVRALVRRDSTYGPFPGTVNADDGALVVAGRSIPFFHGAEPRDLPWSDVGVDVVVDCTGRFRTADSAGAHLEAGARKVVVSAPASGVDATIVMGVNDEEYDPDQHLVVSNASCTTNCLAPMVKVLDDTFGLRHGFTTTVHAYTGDQNLLDAPHKDLRRARSAAVNIVPTTTGAARAVGVVLPHLQGRLDGLALRVPVVDSSLVDLAALLEVDVTAADVVDALRVAAESGPLAGRLRVDDEPLVSVDVIGDPASCVVDAALTQASGQLVKVFGWYDNEWGYTCRLAELARLVGD